MATLGRQPDIEGDKTYSKKFEYFLKSRQPDIEGDK